MTYNIEFQISALIILALFMYELFKKKERTLESRAYKAFVIYTLFLTIDDIICPITLATRGCPDILRLVTGKLYIVFMFQCIMAVSAFTIALTINDEKKQSAKLFVYKICPYIGYLFGVIAIMLPLQYVSEQKYVYTYGPCSSFCYAIGGILAVTLPIYTFLNRKIIPFNKQMPIYLYVVIEGLITLLEKLNPELLLTSFGLVIDIVIIFFTLQNPYIKQLEDKNKKIQGMSDKIVRAFVSSVDAKDRYTRGHSQRVAEYSLEIAKRMRKSEEEQKLIYTTGLLHDIGKIRVPENIINKSGKLTDEEFELIKLHTVSGYQMLREIFDNEKVAYGVKYHHERYNGRGYPNGLSGEEIPEIARIIGIADAYDAMTSNRSYRDALSQQIVKKEIENGRGTQFDSEIADIMLSMIEEDVNYTMREQKPPLRYILAVDSDTENLKSIVDTFCDDNAYEVLTATNKNETIVQLEKNAISIVLLDYQLSNIELYEEIVKYNIPVIIMTSEKQKEVVGELIKFDIEDYITKPFSPLILKETIHGVLL